MDNAQQRIALAKDVLAKLDAGELRPRFGAYLLPDAKGCLTCALGSMMVACCGVPKIGTGSIGANPARVIECLAPLFSVSELATIEAAFEGRSCMPVATVALYDRYQLETDEEYDALEALIDTSAKAFGGVVFGTDEGEDESEDSHRIRAEAARRVRAIMANIIQHEGRFVPEAL